MRFLVVKRNNQYGDEMVTSAPAPVTDSFQPAAPESAPMGVDQSQPAAVPAQPSGYQ
jgi:hypothetical protein